MNTQWLIIKLTTETATVNVMLIECPMHLDVVSTIFFNSSAFYIIENVCNGDSQGHIYPMDLAQYNNTHSDCIQVAQNNYCHPSSVKKL